MKITVGNKLPWNSGGAKFHVQEILLHEVIADAPELYGKFFIKSENCRETLDEIIDKLIELRLTFKDFMIKTEEIPF